MATNSGVVGVPGIIGGSIFLASIAELPTKSVDGLTIGTSVWVQESNANWRLAVSSATVDHIAVEAVSGYDDLRWLISGGLPETWAQAREREMRALTECAALNEYRHVLAGPQSPPGSGFVADAAVEGGGVKPTAGAATHSFFTNSVFQIPKTGVWAVEFRMKHSAPASSKITECGLANGAGTHLVTIASDASTDATKFYILILGGTTTNSSNQTVANDAAWHNGRLTFDGTETTPKVRMYIDNALAASQATLTNLSDEPMGIYADSSSGASVIISEFVYGFINPGP